MEPRVRSPQPIVFLSQDTELIAAVMGELATAGVKLLGFPTVAALTADKRPGAVLVLDTRVLPEGQDIASLMGQVERLWGSRPVLACIAHSSAIELRLQALRAGVDAFFVGPVAVDKLAARLLELSDAPGADDYQILVVNDQPVAANFAVWVLEWAGMQARSVGDPRQVLETIGAFRPDLVLMDLHMPGVDGIELTALIREHEAISAIPVVFLSSELDKGRQMDTLRVGGNDFIAKPGRPEQLVATVRRNIRTFRRRQGRQQSVLDATPTPVVQAEQAPVQGSGRDGGKAGSQRPPAPGDSDAQLTALVETALGSDGLGLVYQPTMALEKEKGTSCTRPDCVSRRRMTGTCRHPIFCLPPGGVA